MDPITQKVFDEAKAAGTPVIPMNAGESEVKYQPALMIMQVSGLEDRLMPFESMIYQVVFRGKTFWWAFGCN